MIAFGVLNFDASHSPLDHKARKKSRKTCGGLDQSNGACARQDVNYARGTFWMMWGFLEFCLDFWEGSDAKAIKLPKHSNAAWVFFGRHVLAASCTHGRFFWFSCDELSLSLEQECWKPYLARSCRAYSHLLKVSDCSLLLMQASPVAALSKQGCHPAQWHLVSTSFTVHKAIARGARQNVLEIRFSLEIVWQCLGKPRHLACAAQGREGASLTSEMLLIQGLVFSVAEPVGTASLQSFRCLIFARFGQWVCSFFSGHNRPPSLCNLEEQGVHCAV